MYCLQETHLRSKDTWKLKVKEWKKIFSENGNKKKAWISVLTSDKIDFKTKTVTRDKEGHYVMIKRTIQQETVTIWHSYKAKHAVTVWPTTFIPGHLF